MTDTSGKTSCATRSWRVAACGGGAVVVVLVALTGAGLFSALIIGVICAAILGFVMTRFMCPQAEQGQEQSSKVQDTAAPLAEPAAKTVSEPVAAPASEPAHTEPAVEPATASASASSQVKPSMELPGQIELANRKGTWKYKGPSATA